MDKKQQFHIWYWAAAAFGIILLQQMWAWNQRIEVIPYSEFVSDLKSGKIEEVRVSGNYIEGDWKKPTKTGRRSFVTTRVPADVAKELEQYHVRFSGEVQSTFLSTVFEGFLVSPCRSKAGIQRRAFIDRSQ
jgi:cell division protease FtsH